MHPPVRSLFVKHWVNAGIFPKEMGRFYHHLFERRPISDYKDLVVFTHGDVDARLASEAGGEDRRSLEGPA
jgi:uncharacterized protein (UPF0332 family)